LETPQNLSNHGRVDPPFHLFVLPVVMINVIVAIVTLIRHPGLGTAWFLVLSIAAVLAVFKIRLYALRVQDRLIRLEERVRLESVLKDPLRARIGELTDQQFIGLRFASNDELPGLVERALAEKLNSKDIKKAVTNWRPDYSRV